MFGVKIPKLKKYAGEKPATALRIIRSHIGGMAGQLSTILVTLGQLGTQLDRIEAKSEAAHVAARRAAWAVSKDTRENGEYWRALNAKAVADDGSTK